MQEVNTPGRKRQGARAARRVARAKEPAEHLRAVHPGVQGGRLALLSEADMQRVNHTALRLLDEVGMADPTASVSETVIEAGGRLSAHGRLLFPRALVEDVLARTRRGFVLPGQKPEHDLELGGGRVHFGTGGMSPYFVDFETGDFRPARLTDVYDAARLVDRLDNIHSFWRPVVACDVEDERAMDLSSLYACAAGTSKHLGSAFVSRAHIPEAIAMLDGILGGEGRFRERPFVTLSCCPVVPPLRFAHDNCDNLETAIRHGMPATLVCASQAGATSPAALAGSVAQTVAESLACLVFANLVDPNCRVLFAPKPFVADLRTGSMCAGSAEQAILTAASAQMAGFYRIPGSVAGGMTDSKLPDAQAGVEKACSALLAGHSGSNHATQAAGGLASLMADALEAYVIDNDMLGAILRTIRGLEVTDEDLSFEVIRDVVLGDGHFLAQSQTLERMQRDYFYADIIDRRSFAEWRDGGGGDMRSRARLRVRAILSAHYPRYIDAQRDKEIRAAFDIRLQPQDMRSGNARWPLEGESR